MRILNESFFADMHCMVIGRVHVLYVRKCNRVTGFLSPLTF